MEYYDGPGQADDTLIEIPKGSYVPRFTSRERQAVSRPLPWVRIVTGAAALVLAAAIWILMRDAAPVAEPVEEIRSVAVLPFLNLSSDPENEYFSDGVTEQLTDLLSQVDGLRVASRTSAFAFTGEPANAQDIGSRLRVGALVEGSVRKAGDSLRITAQLIRTSDGFHLWSKTFERSMERPRASPVHALGS